jgi:mannitol/fructose-specific phosphotransferase system IIA component (Ntr-type)
VHLLRYLRRDQVLLELESALTPPDVAEYAAAAAKAEESGRALAPTVVDPRSHAPDGHTRWLRKKAVVEELVGLFDRSGDIRNARKLARDMLDRERQAPTAVGGRLAIPHVRSMQPRRLVVCVARARAGVDYFAPDGEDVGVFFCLAAPKYDDGDYWKLYRWAAHIFNENAWLVDAILDAADEDEILYLLKSLR